MNRSSDAETWEANRVREHLERLESIATSRERYSAYNAQVRETYERGESNEALARRLEQARIRRGGKGGKR